MTILHLYVTNPAKFLNGSLEFALTVSPEPPENKKGPYSENPYIGSFNISMPVNDGYIRDHAVNVLNDKKVQVKAESEVKIQHIDTAIQSLIAIEHKEETK